MNIECSLVLYFEVEHYFCW